jgi:hypothetical protein
MFSYTAKLWDLVVLAGAIETSALAAGGGPPPKVTPTLDHKNVLPLRTRWLAYQLGVVFLRNRGDSHHTTRGERP